MISFLGLVVVCLLWEQKSSKKDLSDAVICVHRMGYRPIWSYFQPSLIGSVRFPK